MPDSVVALAILVIAVLPGSVYIWAFERQASAFGVNLADRTLRFIAMSLIFHLILGWPEYWLYRLTFTGERFGAGQFAAAWSAGVVLVMIPATVGTVLGGMYATRGTALDGPGSATGSPRIRKIACCALRWAKLRRRGRGTTCSPMLRSPTCV